MPEEQRRVKAQNAHGGQETVILEGYPDECPVCHKAQRPRHLGTVLCGSETEGAGVEEVHQCTRADCQRLFIARYRHAVASSPRKLVYLRSVPAEVEAPEIPGVVSDLSPVFVETYSQSLEALAVNLDQIAGAGLRRALEFLVKDYAISKSDGDEKAGKKIRKMRLANCIEEYIDDARVKKVAEATTWLGNDETHYTRRWEGKDVKDLLSLIRLTIYGIHNILLSEQVIEEMHASEEDEADDGDDGATE